MKKELTEIKICGVTDVDNALDIVEFEEVKYIGCVHYGYSKRHIDLDKIEEIFREVKSKRPDIRRVLVLVNPSMDLISKAMKVSGADIVQLSGDESPDLCNQLDLYSVWKTIHIKSGSDIEKINDDLYLDHYVLDTKIEGQYGGTGVSFNFELFKKAKEYTRKLVLAGGLNPENLVEAIYHAEPKIIDISSGVESSPGIKDIRKVEMIVELVKGSMEY